MATYAVIAERPTVQVLGPTLVQDVQEVQFRSYPSGSILLVYVPTAAWRASGPGGSVQPLADAVENIIAGGLATSASAYQDVDEASGLLTDFVRFIVTYTPSDPSAFPLQAAVDVPYDVLIADTQFGSFLAGGSALERVQAAYQRLQADAGS